MQVFFLLALILCIFYCGQAAGQSNSTCSCTGITSYRRELYGGSILSTQASFVRASISFYNVSGVCGWLYFIDGNTSLKPTMEEEAICSDSLPLLTVPISQFETALQILAPLAENIGAFSFYVADGEGYFGQEGHL